MAGWTLAPPIIFPLLVLFSVRMELKNSCKSSLHENSSGVASSISEGDIFIYSCSAQLISFEIDCFYGL